MKRLSCLLVFFVVASTAHSQSPLTPGTSVPVEFARDVSTEMGVVAVQTNALTSNVLLYDSSSLELLAALDIGDGYVSSLKVSPSAEMIAVAGKEGTSPDLYPFIQILDKVGGSYTSGRKLGLIGTYPVSSLTFNQSENRLYGAKSLDGHLLAWNTDDLNTSLPLFDVAVTTQPIQGLALWGNYALIGILRNTTNDLEAWDVVSNPSEPNLVGGINVSTSVGVRAISLGTGLAQNALFVGLNTTADSNFMVVLLSEVGGTVTFQALPNTLGAFPDLIKSLSNNGTYAFATFLDRSEVASINVTNLSLPVLAGNATPDGVTIQAAGLNSFLNALFTVSSVNGITPPQIVATPRGVGVSGSLVRNNIAPAQSAVKNWQQYR